MNRQMNLQERKAVKRERKADEERLMLKGKWAASQTERGDRMDDRPAKMRSGT